MHGYAFIFFHYFKCRKKNGRWLRYNKGFEQSVNETDGASVESGDLLSFRLRKRALAWTINSYH